MPPQPRLMLFDLYHGGHHGQYIQALVKHWADHSFPGRLDIVVSHEFSLRYPDLLDLGRAHPSVTFHPTKDPLHLNAKSGRLAVLRNDRRIGHVLRDCVLEHRPTHCLLMYFDHVQLSLATNLQFDFPISFSGIYFRPSFYYRATGAAAPSARGAVDDLQKRTLLKLALRNPHVDALLSLDPYAVDHIRRLGERARVRHVPEPFEAHLQTTETPEQTRLRLGIDSGREVMLLFGSLDPRKGVLQLMDALTGLPADLSRRVCLLMAGEIASGRGEILAGTARLRTHGIQVVHLDEFIADAAEMHRLFGAASLVLMPYQNHVGSSNVLVRAAAAGIPVLGQSYGMLGAIIRDRRLGLCVDTTQPAAIMQAVTHFLDPGATYPFNAESARAFAAANTEYEMASTVFNHVFGESAPGT